MATLGPAAQETSSTAYIILAEYVHMSMAPRQGELVVVAEHTKP